ncbi:MAG: hypothetical protein NZ551_08695 [Microscillaceae bacterium]|nr:hypothetical protein [Microscillaceae bacterium]MDW8461278.1 hypothetical protein [Cytophagales bacterium]
MYLTLVFLHSWLRWLLIVLAIAAVAQALLGFLSKKDYTQANNRISAGFIGTMHLQLVIGLLLYFVYSPLGLPLFSQSIKAVMKNPDNRFWAVEHISTMLVAVIIAQIGRSAGKKAKTDTKRFRMELIFFGIAMALVLISIPWSSRPWLRF